MMLHELLKPVARCGHEEWWKFTQLAKCACRESMYVALKIYTVSFQIVTLFFVCVCVFYKALNCEVKFSLSHV